MKKFLLVSLAGVAMVLAFVLPNLFAADAPVAAEAPRVDAPGDDYMIPKPEGIEPKELSIPFPHSVHAEFDCARCHHTGDVTQGCTDSGCHDLFVATTPEERRDIRFFEKAYHDQCIGCHRELKKAGAPTGPVACVGCHPKPEEPKPAG